MKLRQTIDSSFAAKLREELGVPWPFWRHVARRTPIVDFLKITDIPASDRLLVALRPEFVTADEARKLAILTFKRATAIGQKAVVDLASELLATNATALRRKNITLVEKALEGTSGISQWFSDYDMLRARIQTSLFSSRNTFTVVWSFTKIASDGGLVSAEAITRLLIDIIKQRS